MATLTATMVPQPVPGFAFGTWLASAAVITPFSGRRSAFTGVVQKPTFSFAGWTNNGGTFSPARGGTALLTVYQSLYYWAD